MKVSISLPIHKRAYDVPLDKVRKKDCFVDDNLVVSLDCAVLESTKQSIEVSIVVHALLLEEFVRVLELPSSRREVLEVFSSPLGAGRGFLLTLRGGR